MDHHIVTDEELARARSDPAFRKQLIAANLDNLLMMLARMRASVAVNDPASVQQIREGAQLAVKLADLLQRSGGEARVA